MKMNKWTVGLAAAGLVSLASVAQAQDSNSVATKLATTSLSGYVSTSYQWAIGSDIQTHPGSQRAAGADRFAVDVISLTLASPQSSGDWGAGYNVQLWVGDDASALGLGDGVDNGEDEIAVKNAYLSLQVPVGNGLSVDVGRFDTILGMESIDANRNPHYTHSNGYAIEPTLHDGLKTSYQLTDNVGVSLLFANTIDASNNGAPGAADSDRRTYGVALNLTAPDSMGALSGATLDAAWIEGNADGGTTAITNMYVGASIPLPIDKLSAGLAWDNREQDGAATDSALGLYLEYAHSDKLTLNTRVERVHDGVAKTGTSDAWDITVTANYALWAGVTSRLEYRWTIEDTDLDADGNDETSLFANLIYEF